MGNHWGSIHFRTDNRDLVAAALEPLAAQGMRFLVGPPLGGWVAVYPSIDGRTGEEIVPLAKTLGVDAFELILHDDDVFAYNFVRDGRLVDEYVNKPGYFSARDRAREDKLTGNVFLYADLLKKPAAALQKILRRDDQGAFEAADRLVQFAKALGIANVETSYEYLMEDEPSGVKHRRKFVHVPAEAAMHAERAGREDAFQRQVDELKSAGLLVAAYRGKKDQFHTLFPGFDDTGFLRYTTDHKRQSRLEAMASTWPKKLVQIDLALGFRPISVSPDGRRLVRSSESGIEVRDTRSLDVLSSRREPWGVLAYSPDGQRIAWQSPEAVIVTSTQLVEVVRTRFEGHVRETLFHPDGSTLLLVAEHFVRIVSLSDGTGPKLFVGGRSAVADQLQEMQRAHVLQLDLDEYESSLNVQVEKTLAEMEKMLSKKLRKSGVTFDEPSKDQLRQQMRQQHAEQVARLRRIQAGEVEDSGRAVEQVQNIAFAAGGALLCCCTDVGLRVFDWSAIRAGGDTPQRRFSFTEGQTSDFGNYLYAMAVDEPGNRLLFGGMMGAIYAMDLADGSVKLCYSMPDQMSVIDLHLSRDGRHLAALCRASLKDPRNVRDQRHSVLIFRTPD